MRDLHLDVRDAARQLSGRPAHTVLMVLTLALGIGGNTAVFTIVDHTLLRSVPFAHPDRLVDVIDWDIERGGGGSNLFPEKIRGWQTQPAIFERFEGFSPATWDATSPGAAAKLHGAQTSVGLFAMLAVSPRLGRLFDERDGAPGSDRVTIISDAIWRQRFGADPDVLNRSIVLNDEPYRVVGVMRPSFRLMGRFDDLYLPVNVEKATTESAGRSFWGLARLAEGLSLEAAQSRADLVARQWQKSNPIARTWGLRLTRKQVMGVDQTMRTILWVLLGAVVCVLLIACVNVANMRLSAMASHTRETAIRCALGASRGRLIRASLVESFVVSAVGGVCGVVVAGAAVAATLRMRPARMAFMETTEIGLDGRILAYVALMTVATTILFGLLPAIRGSRADLDAMLRGTATALGRRRGSRWSHGLVAAQTALATVLVVGATLLTRTFVNLHAIQTGFDLDRLSLFELMLPTDRYPTPLSRVMFLDELTARVSAAPGVVGAAFTRESPPSGGTFTLGGGLISVGLETEDGRSTEAASPMVGSGTVSASFFDVSGLKILGGRSFVAADGDDAIVVNRPFASHFWPGVSPIGRRVRIGSASSPWLTVVGVVSPSMSRMGDRELPLQFYWNGEARPAAVAANQPARPGRRFYYAATLYVRSAAGVDTVPGVRGQLAVLDPKLPIERIAAAESLFDDAFDRQRFTLLLMSSFAAIALVLAMAGVAAVLSHAVVVRRREIGIRMALGASRSHVLRVIVAEGVAAIGVGLACGWFGAAGLTRIIRTLLYGVGPWDPASFATTAALLVMAGTAACAVPAWRALKVEPAVILRTE